MLYARSTTGLNGGDEGGPKKQPYLIRHRDGSPILCASIGQLPAPDHGEHDGFVIITADAQD